MPDKELIYREDLIAEYGRVHKGPAGGARELMRLAPAVDAVEVVRCGECMHRGDGDICPMRHLIFDVPSASYIWIDQTLNDGFCSFGVRKEGALWMQKKE